MALARKAARDFFEENEEIQNWILVMVPRGGIEPPTPAFSVQCSTN
jgi:hypothetical protein